MITFFTGMVVGGIVVAFRSEIRLVATLLISKLWGKIFGDKNNPTA